jgi:hypothetical protein
MRGPFSLTGRHIEQVSFKSQRNYLPTSPCPSVKGCHDGLILDCAFGVLVRDDGGDD